MPRQAKSCARRCAPSTGRMQHSTSICAPGFRLPSQIHARAYLRPMSSSGCAGGMPKKSEPPNVAFEVHFRPEAEADLIGLYEYIAGAAGIGIAGGYIDRIEAACMALADFPERGTPRDDIQPGLRTI